MSDQDPDPITTEENDPSHDEIADVSQEEQIQEDNDISQEEDAPENVPPPGRNKRFRIIAIIVAVALVVGGVVGVLLYQRHLETVRVAAIAECNSVAVSHRTARFSLQNDIKQAQTTLADVKDQVQNQATYDALNKAVQTAQTVVTQQAGTCGDDMTTADARAVTSTTNDSLASFTENSDAVRTSVKAANDSHEAWLFDQAKTAADIAKTALDADVASVDTSAAESTYSSSDGQVSDDSTRQALRAAIDELNNAVTDANAIDTTKATTTDEYTALATTLTDATTRIDTAKAAVDTAVQSVNDSVSAKKAADAATASRTSSNSSSSSSNKSTGSGSNSSTTTTGGSGGTCDADCQHAEYMLERFSCPGWTGTGTRMFFLDEGVDLSNCTKIG